MLDTEATYRNSSDFEKSTHDLCKRLVRAEVGHGPRPQDECLIEDRDLDLLNRSALIQLFHQVREGVRYADALSTVIETRK